MGTSLTRSAASASNAPWGVPHATVLYAWLVLKAGHSTRRGGVCRKEVHTVIHVSRYLKIVQRDTKKRDVLKNPTKTEEIQQQKFIDRNLTIITCLLRDSNPKIVCSSRSLFRNAANFTWLPLCISKVPIFLCHPVHLCYNIQQIS